MPKPVQITQAPNEEERPLPMFRRDLNVYRGPDEPDGSPTFNIYDPVRAQYFKIHWAESLIVRLLRPGMTIKTLQEAVSQHSTLQLTAEEIKEFFSYAQQTGLLATRRTSEFLTEQVKKAKLNPILWFLYNYLFIRIPLVNPDAFLNKTISWVRYLFSKPALMLYGFLSLMGMIQLMFRFDEFIHTFSYFFNYKGFVLYALMIVSIKIFHELSHAYVAKSYGLRIPTMGVLFMVLWPVLYTDVTDAWKLSNRKHRLAISAAGVLAEVILAGLCTLGWAWSDPGLWQSVFFVLSSATWISTIIVNINPALRFDGYYLLSDILGIDNLQTRAFAMTRWQFRKWFLGINVPPPETELSVRTRAGMMFYSVYTWIYRLFLYTAIAALVYYRFTKALGVLLFASEIVIFLGWPFYSEFQQLKFLRPVISFNKRIVTTVAVVAFILGWFCLPLPRTERFTAVTAPANNQVLYVPYDARVEAVHVKRGDGVSKGQPLLSLSSVNLESEIALTHLEIEEVKREMDILSREISDRALLPEKQGAVSALEEKFKGLQEIQKKLTIKAEVAGEIYQWDEYLAAKQSVSKDQVLGQLAASNDIEVVCFVPEALLKSIEIGKEVQFRCFGSLEFFKGSVKMISISRARYLRYPQLASVYSGELPVLPTGNNALAMVESYYPVEITLSNVNENLRFGQTGEIFARGHWRSRLMSVLRYFTSVLWRESGF